MFPRISLLTVRESIFFPVVQLVNHRYPHISDLRVTYIRGFSLFLWQEPVTGIGDLYSAPNRATSRSVPFCPGFRWPYSFISLSMVPSLLSVEYMSLSIDSPTI